MYTHTYIFTHICMYIYICIYIHVFIYLLFLYISIYTQYHTPTTRQGGRGAVPQPHHTTGGEGDSTMADP